MFTIGVVKNVKIWVTSLMNDPFPTWPSCPSPGQMQHPWTCTSSSWNPPQARDWNFLSGRDKSLGLVEKARSFLSRFYRILCQECLQDHRETSCPWKCEKDCQICGESEIQNLGWILSTKKVNKISGIFNQIFGFQKLFSNKKISGIFCLVRQPNMFGPFEYRKRLVKMTKNMTKSDL